MNLVRFHHERRRMSMKRNEGVLFTSFTCSRFFANFQLTSDETVSVPGASDVLRPALDRAHVLLEPHTLDNDHDARQHEQVPLGSVPHSAARHAPAEPLAHVHGQHGQRAHSAAPRREVQIGIRNGRLVIRRLRAVGGLAHVHLAEAVGGVHDDGEAAGPHAHEDQGHDALGDGAHEHAAQGVAADVGDDAEEAEGDGDGGAGGDPLVLFVLGVLVVGLVGGEAQGREQGEEGPGGEAAPVDHAGFGGERGGSGVVGHCCCSLLFIKKIGTEGGLLKLSLHRNVMMRRKVRDDDGMSPARVNLLAHNNIIGKSATMRQSCHHHSKYLLYLQYLSELPIIKINIILVLYIVLSYVEGVSEAKQA